MNTEPTIRDIADCMLKREMSYAYVTGALEAMLKEVLCRFATPEQSKAWIEGELKRQEELAKK